jgi:DNA methyltransferase 1-associated protein 1
MTSHDVRDMLDLPNEASRPAKRIRTTAPRPILKGLAREVQNLSVGDNPIAIVPEITTFKKKRFGSRKPVGKWEQREFTNSARDDKDFVLRHWRRKDDTKVEVDEDGEGEVKVKMEDSSFAKFSVQVQVPSYAPEQYKEQLEHPDWTKEETDYLISVVKEFDLRWPLIWDRYDYVPIVDGEAGEVAVMPIPKVRNLEDLKARS